MLPAPATDSSWASFPSEEGAPTAPATTPPVAARPRAAASWPFVDLLLAGIAGLLLVAVIAVAISRHRQARERFVADLLTAKAAFQSFLHTHDEAPPDTAPGLVPRGMEPFLGEFAWSKPTPVGGVYRWVARDIPSPGSPKVVSGAIALTAFAPAPEIKLSVDELLEIDRRIDDGNLTTGDFRTGFNGWPTLTVRANP